MKGAIIGDLIGSRFERFNHKSKEFELFDDKCQLTDDSVLTIAICDAYLNKKDYAIVLKEYAKENPTAGFGGSFIGWVDGESMEPYNSWGNGSAMRVSALAWLIDDMEDLMNEAKKSAEVTHNHPEGIKGAQAIAACVLMARQQYTKAEMQNYIEETFGYNLKRTVKSLVETYEFNVSCQGSVPEAIICFCQSIDFEDCLRTAISIGGDSDTIASMACAIAEPYYKIIPESISAYANTHILKNEKYTSVYNAFNEKVFEQSNKSQENK